MIRKLIHMNRRAQLLNGQRFFACNLSAGSECSFKLPEGE